LPTDNPIEESCGECRECIDACPAGAIKESAAELDISACKAQLETFRKRPGIGHHICGICVKVCR
jgi:epoxyqueuosine reductase QueG